MPDGRRLSAARARLPIVLRWSRALRSVPVRQRRRSRVRRRWVATEFVCWKSLSPAPLRRLAVLVPRSRDRPVCGQAMRRCLPAMQYSRWELLPRSVQLPGRLQGSGRQLLSRSVPTVGGGLQRDRRHRDRRLQLPPWLEVERIGMYGGRGLLVRWERLQRGGGQRPPINRRLQPVLLGTLRVSSTGRGHLRGSLSQYLLLR